MFNILFISNQLNLRVNDSFGMKTVRKAFVVVNYNCAGSLRSFILPFLSEMLIRLYGIQQICLHFNDFVSAFVSPTEFCFNVKLKSTRFLKWNQTGNSLFVMFSD